MPYISNFDLREILVTEYKFTRTILTGEASLPIWGQKKVDGGRVGGVRAKCIHELICKSFHNQMYDSTIKNFIICEALEIEKGENWA